MYSNNNIKTQRATQLYHMYRDARAKKIFVVGMEVTPTLREKEHSRTYLYHLKTRTQCNTKVASSIGTNVIGLTVMRSTGESGRIFGRYEGHLRTPSPYRAIRPPYHHGNL